MVVFFVKTKFICSFSENSKILSEDLLLFLIYSTCVAFDCSKKNGYFIWQRSELNLEINIHII